MIKQGCFVFCFQSDMMCYNESNTKYPCVNVIKLVSKVMRKVMKIAITAIMKRDSNMKIRNVFVHLKQEHLNLFTQQILQHYVKS